MTRFEALQAKRSRARQAAAELCWEYLSGKLEHIGVEYRLFGSFARGHMMEHSDIDLMIMGNLSDERRLAVRRAAHEATSSYNVFVDLYFAEDMSDRDRKACLAD